MNCFAAACLLLAMVALALLGATLWLRRRRG
jgi:hypothetical protein